MVNLQKFKIHAFLFTRILGNAGVLRYCQAIDK